MYNVSEVLNAHLSRHKSSYLNTMILGRIAALEEATHDRNRQLDITSDVTISKDAPY